MKALYITAAGTGLVFLIFLFTMTSIEAPLGGEPFSVVDLQNREKAETELNERKITERKKKRVRPSQQVKKQQKNPSYFQKTSDGNSITIKGKGQKQTADIKHLSPAKSGHLKPSKKHLEFIDTTGLPAAPIPEFIEKTKYGYLPRIADDGRRPLDVYSRPFARELGNSKPLKTISIVVTNLGLSEPITLKAIETLPPEVTLSFNPYSNQLKKWTKKSRNNGHEIILEIPMEPYDYPDNDPGPHTLLSHQTDKINIDRLNWLMSRMSGYVGIANIQGGKFISVEDALAPIMREVKNRGLLYIDYNPDAIDTAYQISQEIQLEYLQSTIKIDKILDRESIDKALKKLEQAALTHGQAIGVATAFPLSIQRLNKWAEDLKKRGIYLVPLTKTLSNQQS